MRNYNRFHALLGNGGVFTATAQQGATVRANTEITDKDRELAELRAKLKELESKAAQVESGLHNVSCEIKGNMMTLTVDLSKVEPTAGTMSKAGKELKTNRIATSHGNYSIELPGGQQGYFSLNVGQYPKARK